MTKRIRYILFLMTLSIASLIFTQGFWLYKDYKYYNSQPLLSSNFSYFVPSNTAVPKIYPGAPVTKIGLQVEVDTNIIHPPGRGIALAMPALPAQTYKELPYKAPVSYIINKMKLQFGISIFIIAFTVSCLVYMLITIFKQRKLSITKNEFINNMTHELKTPLATVSVAIEAMRSFGVLSDKDKTQLYLSISKNELDHLSRLIEMILEQSIFESEKMKINKEYTDLHKLQETVVKKFLLSKNPPCIQLVLDAESPMASIDPVHIGNALSNLIDNAIKYTPQASQIVIQSKVDKSHWRFTIQDNGIAIPKAYQKDIFERFFRIPNKRSKSIKGFGLGLSYVKQVVELHKGYISLNSNDSGNLFTIIIPHAKP